MTSPLSQVAERFGALAAVRLTEFAPKWIEAIRFEFENGFLNVTADADDDTIKLEMEVHEHQPAPSIVTYGPWLHLLGSHVRWVWRLTNHRGYEDAIQFEFTRNGASRNIQLVAEASRLWTYELAAFDDE